MNHPNSSNGLVDKAVSSNICICGESKLEGRPFCYSCYKALVADDIKKYQGLYRRGEAFYEAYEEAKEYLLTLIK